MKKSQICINAGILFSFISEHKKMSFENLIHYTGMKSSDIYLALGWLSRDEQDIYIFEENDNLIITFFKSSNNNDNLLYCNGY